MKKCFSVLWVLVFLFAGCENNTSPTGKTPEKQEISPEDTLYRAVLGFHDDAMPKMGKMIGYEKVIEQKIDSLGEVLKKKKNASTEALKNKYESLLVQVKTAEKGMNDWMDSFNPDPKFPTKEDLKVYWEDQYTKAKKMRDDVLEAVDSASAKLSE